LSGLRVEGGEVTPLVAVATPASEDQVIGVGRAAVLFYYYMIYLVREEGYFSREQTVFATIPRVFDDVAAQGRGNICHTPRAPVRCWRLPDFIITITCSSLSYSSSSAFSAGVVSPLDSRPRSSPMSGQRLLPDRASDG
jgi:hypothetical protein